MEPRATANEAELIAHARERADAGLVPEGYTIPAGEPEEMREELMALLLTDAEENGRAA
ncbi:hypothetical protein [Nocardiopsis lambiniae]|uniref:Uncharacterized protein n=1 Tax=Nocardiopsis lambiniae TaxID=3075539 RepID=A0ABU2MGX9_9ACTN|nr:hypothetical protein [Nocardiopsis sp. DSM 44743]MDT0331843.1 hypothetical protein [Nocardiopsis sp. DSM 44743]